MRIASKALFSAATAAATLCAAPALAADYGDSFYGGDIYYGTDDKVVELRGGIGIIGIEAHEYVYSSPGAETTISELIWQSVAPMATVDVTVNFPDDWTARARLRGAMYGDSYMEDYDWFGPDFVSYSADDWTHRSQHTNTNLDWYLDASLAVGKDVLIDENARLNVNAGLRYVDVKWSAVGGSYVYSDTTVDNAGNNFRAYTGTFADTPAISYRQQLPMLFAGLDASAEDGPWKYDVSAQAGVTFLGLATDHHWMRTPPLRFLDWIKPTPVFSMAATAGYDFSDNLGLFVTGSVEKMWVGRADTEQYNNNTGALTGSSPDSGGADLATVGLSGGIKGSF